MTSLPKIALEWQRFAKFSPPALYEMLRFRQQIFVVEQRSPYPDLDGHDAAAWHLTARAPGSLVGYLRLLPPSDSAAAARIGRVAVVQVLRGRGLGRRLMGEALTFCRRVYPARRVTLDAQLHSARFYETFGFCPEGVPYDDFGVAHIAMALPAEVDPTPPA
jgi:ElaA protein